MTDADLTLDELGWLLGLATARRKKREHDLERMRRKADQSLAAFEEGRQKVERSAAWARQVEDKLILAIGAIDEARLRRHQRHRFHQLRAWEAMREEGLTA